MTLSLHVDNVTFAYEPARPVLQDVTFDVARGTFLAIVGPNGAGKSTLIGLLSGQLKPLSGEVRLGDASLRSFSARNLAQQVAVVRQEFVPAFGFSVSETVMMARTSHYNQLGFESAADRRLVAQALERTDTARFASRPLAQLSGGERQRVFIARALAQDTPILLLDEPTSFLDFRHQVATYDLLKSIQRDKGTTVAAVTHDINLAAQYCDQVLLLRPSSDGPSGGPGLYRLGSTNEVFTPAELQRAFGVPVFSAPVGAERVFLPLGKMAKDAAQASPSLGSHGPSTESA
ncbi:MAG: ABC transporter ATP-binding protein [Sedimentisphaerales bacterium]|nr:ABC transporter ATP-binding protein [Sedimentisphaerales bacterium]